MHRLARIWYRRNNHKWIDVIDGICGSYNSTYHSGIHGKPKDVTDQNAANVFYQLYKGIINKNPGKPKFKIGDKVHVTAKKTLFGKKYLQQYTADVYIIKNIKMTNPITYTLTTEDLKPVVSSYYGQELVRASSSD